MQNTVFALFLILLTTACANAGGRAHQCRAALVAADDLAATLEVDGSSLAQARQRAFEVCNSMDVDSALRAKAFEHEASRLRLAGNEPLAILLLQSAADHMRATDPESEGLIVLLDALLPYVGRAHGADAILPITEEALTVRRRVFPRVSEEVARGLLYLGQAQKGVGDLAAAERTYREAAQIANECCGPKNDVLAVAYSSLADLFAEQGKTDEAALWNEKSMLALEEHSSN